MKTISRIMILAFVTLAAMAQAPPATTNQGETVCTLTVNDKGEQVFRCAFPTAPPAQPGQPPAKEEKDAADYYVKCESKTGNRWTLIAIEPLEAEVRFVDKRLITNDAAGQPAIWNEGNVPMTAYIRYRDWLALPQDAQWGAVKIRPPTQNTQFMLTRECMIALAAKLKLSTAEPY